MLDIVAAEVRLAYDGTTALRAIDALRPAVMVLDPGVPGMDGYEVTYP